MSQIVGRLQVFGHRVLFPDTDRGMLIQQVGVAASAALVVCVVGWLPAIALPVAICLLLAPSRVAISLFLVYMVASHQYLSFATVSFGGIEWHPREFLLFFLLAHWSIQLLLGRVQFRYAPVHVAVGLYASYYALTFLVGLLSGMGLHDIVKECRYPVFLLAYPVLATLVRNRADLRFYVHVLFCLILAIAAASLGYFSYAMLSGNIVQLNQTPLGEFMHTRVGPIAVQSVRPNGHMFFEVAIVVLASLVFCRAESRRRRAAYGLLIIFFGMAVLVTTMRTAYIALAVSLVVLAFLMLPGIRAQFIIASVGVAAGTGMLLAGGYLVEKAFNLMPQLDLSLKARGIEISGAWAMFMKHPVFGNGMGSSFEALGLAIPGMQRATGQVQYQSLHNVWMYFLYKGGIVGIMLAVFGLWSIAVRGYQLLLAPRDERERCFLRGMVAAFVGQMVASLAMPRLYYPSGIVFVAMMACAFMVLGNQESANAGKPETGVEAHAPCDASSPPCDGPQRPTPCL